MALSPIWPIAGAPTSGTIPTDNVIALCNYYVQRLISQYATKPNAQRLIAILTKQAIMDDLGTQLANAFDLATAVGPQLDILGKYLGASRIQGTPINPGFFSLWDGQSALDPTLYKGTWDPATNVPALPAAAGGNNGWWYVASATGNSTAPIAADFTCGDVIVSNGSAWSQDTSDCGNGLTDGTNPAINANATFYGYGQASEQINSLTDTSYRTLLILLSISRATDGTLSQIMSLLNTLFPNLISLVDNQNMTLTYYVNSSVPLSAETLASYLPRPMGVGITVVIVTPAPAGGDVITTEGGVPITTEGGVPLTTE